MRRLQIFVLALLSGINRGGWPLIYLLSLIALENQLCCENGDLSQHTQLHCKQSFPLSVIQGAACAPLFESKTAFVRSRWIFFTLYTHSTIPLIFYTRLHNPYWTFNSVQMFQGIFILVSRLSKSSESIRGNSKTLNMNLISISVERPFQTPPYWSQKCNRRERDRGERRDGFYRSMAQLRLKGCGFGFMRANLRTVTALRKRLVAFHWN